MTTCIALIVNICTYIPKAQNFVRLLISHHCSQRRRHSIRSRSTSTTTTRNPSAMVGGAPVAGTDGVWAFASDYCSAAVARPDGSVDVFNVSAGARVSERIPGAPSAGGTPSALAITGKRERTSYLVATGTNGGHLSVGSNVVKLMNSGKVAALEYSEPGLFVCGGTDKSVVLLHSETGSILKRYSIASDHRGNLSALAVSSDAKRIAVCSQNISVIDVESAKKTQGLAGHASPVTAAKFFANDTRLATGSIDQQHIFIWDVSPQLSSHPSSAEVKSSGRKKRKRKSITQRTLHTLIAPEQGVRRIDIHEAESGTVSIVALLKSGTVAVWLNCKINPTEPSTKSSTIIYPCPETSERRASSVHGVIFVDKDHISVVYGSTLKPQAFKLNIRTASDVLYLPKPSANNLLISRTSSLREGQVSEIGASAIEAARAESNALEAVAKGTKGILKLSSTTEPPTRRRKREKLKTEDTNGLPNGTSKADESDDDSVDSSENEHESDADDVVDVEPTLSEKLKTLGVSDVAMKNPSARHFEPIEASGDESMDSRVEVIMQALNMKDNRLLNSVISSKIDYSSIVATVRKLPASKATGELLDTLEAKVEQNPRKALLLVPWIRAILCEHATALISRPKSEAMRSLTDSIVKRNETLDSLSRLEGRLQLMVSQTIRTRAWNKQNLKSAIPQFEYVERSSKGEDIDEPMELAEGSEESNEESDTESVEGSEGDSEAVIRGTGTNGFGLAQKVKANGFTPFGHDPGDHSS